MGQLRKEAQALAVRVRSGDAEAARALLAHSVRQGHGKLALRRLFIAQAMGVAELDEFRDHCAGVLASLPQETADRIARDAAALAETYLRRKTRNA